MEPHPFTETLAAYQRDPLSLLWRVPGIWPIDKPSGPSSNRIVVQARRALGIRKVGHAGTLDPMASGLLLLLAGNATRLFDHLQLLPKTYRADFLLGQRTDSQDATGAPLPPEVWRPANTPPISIEHVRSALEPFLGDILQTPPMHSALKKDGQPLYKLARKGETVEREARPVRVYALSLVDFDGVRGTVEMTVSKGFYVRALIDDLGLALGCGATMTGLVRTAVGPFRVEGAVTVEGIQMHNS